MARALASAVSHRLRIDVDAIDVRCAELGGGDRQYTRAAAVIEHALAAANRPLQIGQHELRARMGAGAEREPGIDAARRCVRAAAACQVGPIHRRAPISTGANCAWLAAHPVLVLRPGRWNTAASAMPALRAAASISAEESWSRAMRATTAPSSSSATDCAPASSSASLNASAAARSTRRVSARQGITSSFSAPARASARGNGSKPRRA